MGRFVVLLDEHLKKRGLTQQEFAEMIGVFQSQISDFKNGYKRSINKDILDKVMTGLGLTKIDDIIKYIPDENPEEK